MTDAFDPTVDWFPYKGSAGVLVREQKAVWPKLLVDFTVAWDPNYYRMYNEGWLGLRHRAADCRTSRTSPSHSSSTKTTPVSTASL